MSLEKTNQNAKELTLGTIYKNWKNHVIFSNIFNAIVGIVVYLIGFGALAPNAGNLIILIGIIVFIITLTLMRIHKKLERNISSITPNNEELKQLEGKLGISTITADFLFSIGIIHYLMTNTLVFLIISFIATLALQAVIKPSFRIAT